MTILLGRAARRARKRRARCASKARITRSRMVIYFISDSTCNAAAALLGWRLAEDGAVVGVVVLQFNDDHLFLETIAIAPPRQGKGHGRRLLRFVEAQAPRRGRDETRLHLPLPVT